jgi:hypothetical protein
MNNAVTSLGSFKSSISILLFLLGFRLALDAVCDCKSLLDGLAGFDFSFQIAFKAIL